MRVKAFVIIIMLLGSWVTRVSAQAPQPDSVAYSKTANEVIDYFNATAGSQLEFFNGAQYVLNPPANIGSWYFQDKNYCASSLIRFNNTWYKNVPVLYDVYNDKMISFSGDDYFVLNTEKISDVYLLDHHFAYVNDPGLPRGFYDVLYNGKSQVLAKRTKFSNDDIVSSRSVKFIYEDRVALFLKKGNVYYPVTGKRTLINLFGDKKKEIKQYIKDHKIDYKKDKERTAAVLAGYYDQLTQ